LALVRSFSHCIWKTILRWHVHTEACAI